MATSIASLSAGLGQVISRTVLIQMNTATGIPIPLAILDVVKEERIDYDAEITDHPVERGMEITDHVQLKNPSLHLKGTISNTPLDLSVAIANLAAGAYAATLSATSSQMRTNLLNSGLSQGMGMIGTALQGKAGNTLSSAYVGAVDAVSRAILLSVYQARLPFSVITRRQRFDNMIIQKMSFPRGEDTGYSLAFEMDLRQLRIVSPLTSNSNQLDEKIISSASSTTNLGSQATQSVSPQMAASIKSAGFLA